MGLLDNLGSILGQSFPGSASSSGGSRPASGGGNWADVLGPGVLGGLIGAFLPGKGGALKAGGATALAAMLWNKYKDRILPPAAGPSPAAAPAYEPAAGAPAVHPAAVRMIRAMVYAAKSDGYLDDAEKSAIGGRLRQLDLGPEGEKLVAQVMNEPLDPQKVAAGVVDPQEALALFMASCAVIKVDHFMESGYLDALAQALGVPAAAKEDILNEVKAG